MSDKKIRAVVITTLTELGLLQPYISQNEAWRRYKRRNVENWIEEGVVAKTEQRNGHFLLSVAELEQAASQNKVKTYYG